MADDSLDELAASIASEDWRAAFQTAQTLHARGVADPLIDTALAVGFQERMQYREALLAAERALAKDPRNPAAAAARAAAASAMGYCQMADKMVEATGLGNGEGLLITARDAFVRRDYAAAKAAAARFLGRDPHHATAKADYHAARWLGDKELESRNELERQFARYDSMPAGVQPARGLELVGDLPTASRVWRRCVELDPAAIYARISLIWILDHTDGHDAALAAIDDLPADMGGLPEVVYLRAKILVSAGRLKEAEKVCWQLVRLSAEDLRFSRLLLWVLKRRGKWHVWAYAFFAILVRANGPIY